jgi:hypothetical protein
MGLLYSLAESILLFMDSGPGLPMTLLCLVIAGIPVTLLHELGHAIAAHRLLGSEVEVSIGTVGKVAEMRLGEVAVSVHALSDPSRIGGSAEFDASRATARDVLLIALAGPAASLIGTFGTAWLLGQTSPGVLHDILWTATLAGAFAVLNLIPIRLQERRNGPVVRTDGRLALDALRVARALR